jgi:hypothetical protein
MCAYKRKTWQQKLHDGKAPHVDIVEKDFAGVQTGQKLLIPTPALIDEYIRQIPEGKAVDSATLRNDLAMEHGAEITCPLTTGIFLRIVAEAAHEAYQEGAPLKKITPFWRVIGESSPTAKKLTFGTEFLKAQRRKEGIL